MTKMGPSDRADEAQMEMLEDKALARLVKERANQPTIQVGVKDLSVPDDACKGGGLQAKEMRGEHQVGSVPVEWVRPEAVTRKAETGADLLARILQHRDSIAGQRPRSRRAKAESNTPAYDALPRLPDGWVWASLDEIADIKGGIIERYADGRERVRVRTVSQLERACPGVSRDMIRRVLRKHKAAGAVACGGQRHRLVQDGFHGGRAGGNLRPQRRPGDAGGGGAEPKSHPRPPHPRRPGVRLCGGIRRRCSRC